jgi:glycosyltransferase involved in cell wall biosynthesis
VSRYLSFFTKHDVLAAKAVLFWVHDKVPHYLTVGGGPPLPEQGNPLFRTLCAHGVITRVVCVSNWQAEVVKELMANGGEPAVIGNALPPLLLDVPKKPKVKGRMIFCSDPSRGLDMLLKLFARIREKAPYAELHVYWSSFDGYIAMDGVVFKNKVLQTELFEAMQEAQVLLYPNHGHETYCQAALEASAAGCHVIARDYSGIADVMRSLRCGTLIQGELNEAWAAVAVNRTLEVFEMDPVAPSEIPTWSDRANSWLKLMQDALKA